MLKARDAHNMRLIGHHTLNGNGNGGEGLALHVKDGRRVLYIAHESAPVNFSAVDVTDPRKPELLNQTWLPHAGVRSNSLSLQGDLLAVAYQTKSRGDQPAGMELFDVSDPLSPVSVGFFDTSGPHSRGAHFVWLAGDGYAYLATGIDGFEPREPGDDQIVVIVDISDPTKPTETGRWWLPGTAVTDSEPVPPRIPALHAAGGYRAHNINVYPSHPDRAYIAYIDGGIVILDISDRSAPQLVSHLGYHPPMGGFTHTAFPLFERQLLAVTEESIAGEGRDYPKNLWIADISEERNPLLIAAAPHPSLEEYAHRGGRVGAHNIHENDPIDSAWKSEDVIVGTYFNGGVRAFDISNPFRPEEIGYLVPEKPEGSPVDAVQLNDVFVDENRVIYTVDRFTGGLYIVEFDD